MQDMNYCPVCAAQLETRTIDGRERLACSNDACYFVFWNNPTPVVAALVEYHGDIILARNKDWPEGMYGLITGFLEKGETPEQGVVREVKEELGLDSNGVDFIGVYSFEQKNQLIIAYHVVASMGSITLSEEIAEIIIKPSYEIKPWSFGTGLAVRDWLNKNQMSRF